jgi:peptidyl-prolyl cis-trans isomerase C
VSVLRRIWAAAPLLLLLGSLGATAQEAVVARVNGNAITEADMRLAETEIGNDLGSLPVSTKRRVLVEFLIENQLFADAAESQKLGSGGAYNERIQYWRRRNLRDVYFDKAIKNTITDAEARRFYETNVKGTGEEEVRARHIQVRTKEQARDLFEKVAYGTDFAELARKYSQDAGSKEQGGDLGYVSRGQLAPELENAAFGLKRGEVSQPFQTQSGWHILQVDDRRTRKASDFDAVKDRIHAAIMQEKTERIVADLRGRAKIEYVDPEIKKSVGADPAR